MFDNSAVGVEDINTAVGGFHHLTTVGHIHSKAVLTRGVGAFDQDQGLFTPSTPVDVRASGTVTPTPADEDTCTTGRGAQRTDRAWADGGGGILWIKPPPTVSVGGSVITGTVGSRYPGSCCRCRRRQPTAVGVVVVAGVLIAVGQQVDSSQTLPDGHPTRGGGIKNLPGGGAIIVDDHRPGISINDPHTPGVTILIGEGVFPGCGPRGHGGHVGSGGVTSRRVGGVGTGVDAAVCQSGSWPSHAHVLGVLAGVTVEAFVVVVTLYTRRIT
jgi:hypothetical protein